MLVLLWFAGVLAVVLWAAWLLLSGSSPWRARLAAICLLVFVLAAIQIRTGYSLSSVLARPVIYGLACLAYPVMMIAVWRSSRLASALGVAVWLIGLVIVGPAILSVLSLGTSRFFPAAEGRITPTASYRIFLRHSLWGATPYYGYVIYTNPRWFPVIEKEVARGASPCMTDTQPSDTVVSRKRDDDVIQITCRGAPAEVQPVEVELR
jgi:hypothetical protein